MAIVTRTAKGSKLTIAEMDGNINTLASASLVDGVYTITSGSRTDTITALASGSIEIKSFSAGDGSVTAESLSFLPKTFETDTIVVGTYTGIQPTGGLGTGLTVTAVVALNLDDVPQIQSVTVTAGGSGYETGDVVSIATSELGADPSTESTTTELGAEQLSQDQQQRILMTPTGISMPDLPESDPRVVGQLWVDPVKEYAVKRSRG
jgi:hypothetical protein